MNVYVLTNILFTDKYQSPVVESSVFSYEPSWQEVKQTIKKTISYIQYEILIRTGKLQMTNQKVTLQKVSVDGGVHTEIYKGVPIPTSYEKQPSDGLNTQTFHQMKEVYS